MLLLQIIILMVFIFGGLLFVLHHILTKNISSATTHLDTLNADFTRREEEIKQRLAEAQKTSEETISSAKDQADKLRQEVEREVQAAKEKALEEARQESERIIQKAQKARELITNELRLEMEERVASRIRDVLKGIFPEGVQKELHRLWFSDLIKDSLDSLSQLRISPEITEIKVVSAFPLEPTQKSAILKKFKEQLGHDFTLTEEVDATLVGGVLLTLGALVLDGTIVHKIQQHLRAHA